MSTEIISKAIVANITLVSLSGIPYLLSSFISDKLFFDKLLISTRKRFF